MATRRPASSRARLNNNTAVPQPPPPRSRSVMSKTTLSHTTDDGSNSLTASSSKQGASDTAAANIQVVIRCRRRSDREVQENSPIIVSSDAAKSKEISIEASVALSSLGVVTLPPSRTYPFDLVFGPEADQAMIYHDVVSPMLDQVLMGYNCTLFAYGQTGTGKTYTMQGDLTSTPMGNPSPNAGMIPRVLFRLFHQLDSSRSDYSVKVSYVELYNEELRDLLANDLSGPIGSIQPMGMAAKDKVPDSGLKIFDDANKRGVFIQGLEEIPVKNSKDALALLTKGSERRQIAATNFNDHSSRSHSVFSITVHTKDTTLGEDLLKIGKLHLVDLAGSENIGRSGAENKRAREAGMINQSLLTLGRVINALVDKAQHVPYRESKLTRLLQDSLGGRTKTCIIATISPARSNIEETLSTLDYALRAKSIRNKPELNQRMTRNSLLKEYVSEIERLKADLLAAREKHGIFFSEESWNQLNAEQELKQAEILEAKKQVQIVESQMRNVREEFEQSIALLMKKDNELKETKEKLKETEDALVDRERRLETAIGALEEEEIVRKTYQATEVVLDEVATSLKRTTAQGLSDIQRLFEKLDRKASVLNTNKQIVTSNESIITSTVGSVANALADFTRAFSQSMSKMQSETEQFRSSELKKLLDHTEQIDDQFRRTRELLDFIQSQNNLEKEGTDQACRDLQLNHQNFESEFLGRVKTLKTTFEQMCCQTLAAGNSQALAMETSLDALHTLMDGVLRQATNDITQGSQAISEVKMLANTAASEEIARLEQQNEELSRLLDRGRVDAEKAKDELVKRVSGLLGGFLNERQVFLRTAIENVQAGNAKAAVSHQLALEKQHEIWCDMENRVVSSESVINRTGKDLKRLRDGTFKQAQGMKNTLKSGLEDLGRSLDDSIESHSSWTRSQLQLTINSSKNAFEEQIHTKRARLEAMDTLQTELETNHSILREGLVSTSQHVEFFSKQIASTTSDLGRTSGSYHNATKRYLNSIQHASSALAAEGTKEDIPTGTTPRKRTWNYVDQWELTKDREDILKAWREQLVHPKEALVEDDECEENSEVPALVITPECNEAKGAGDDIGTMGTLMDSRKRNVSTSRYSRRAR